MKTAPKLDFEDYLGGIEKESQDDFALLIEFGPKHFNTEMLEYLYHNWNFAYSKAVVLHRSVIVACIFSPIWLFIAGALNLMKFSIGTKIALWMFPLTLFITLGFGIFMRRYYKGKSLRELEKMGKLIREELNLRRNQRNQKMMGL
jgi:hypothetical protein